MLTRNGREVIGALFTSTAESSGSNPSINFSNLSLINTDGKEATGALSYDNHVYLHIGGRTTSFLNCNRKSVSYVSLQSYANYYIGICLGSSNAPETVDDFTMESLELIGSNIAITIASKDAIIKMSVIASNRTSEDITVKEIGIFLHSVGAAADCSDNENCLLYRKVLPSPITIKPDEIYTFTVALR